MNMTLKILSAIALLAVTIAAGSWTIKIWLNDSPLPVPNEVIAKPVPSPAPVQQKAGDDERKDVLPPVSPDKPKFKDEIIVEKDDLYQPTYKPINQPAFLQNIREEGKTYHSNVIGKIEGQASKKDWGIKGNAYFTYLYAVESLGKIKKNDGLTIIEERTFSKVHEDVFVSKYEVEFDLPEELSYGFVALEVLCGGDGTLSVGALSALNQLKIPFTDQMFGALRDNKLLPAELDPRRIIGNMTLFAKPTGERILEGKKVKITFKDGQGITSIKPLDGSELSQQEVDVIKRTNYVMDHYLFPDRNVAVNDEWDVSGDTFAGFLDPRLQGKITGKVTVSRLPDFTNQNGETSKKIRLKNGTIQFEDKSSKSSEITGQLNGIKGVCLRPDKLGIITSAQMSGTMEYRNVSTDHLLFEAEMRVAPRFDISYECKVE